MIDTFLLNNDLPMKINRLEKENNELNLEISRLKLENAQLKI